LERFDQDDKTITPPQLSVNAGRAPVTVTVGAAATFTRVGDLDAWLFDLDGVLTDTASVHAAAWKETFDEVLARRTVVGVPFTPFDPVAEYEEFVDGKPRLDGVRSFLASRGITPPEGQESDPTDADTVYGIGNRKNALVLERLVGHVTVFPGSVTLVKCLRATGRRIAVVSASENCTAVLEAADIADLFDVTVDGRVAREQHLHGKPAPDTFLHAASLLGVEPDRAAVVEDAPAGVMAGHAGGFGLVIGVARRATPAALTQAGADVVVTDLSELLVTAPSGETGPVPSGWTKPEHGGLRKGRPTMPGTSTGKDQRP
jgi:beta-phosphoglucomutase family hydrolase